MKRVFCETLEMDVDELEIKAGYSINTLKRQLQYRDECDGVEFIWCYEYTCDNVKLLGAFCYLFAPFILKNLRTISALDFARAGRAHSSVRLSGMQCQASGVLPRFSSRRD